jgi:hypothetical protein
MARQPIRLEAHDFESLAAKKGSIVVITANRVSGRRRCGSALGDKQSKTSA